MNLGTQGGRSDVKRVRWRFVTSFIMGKLIVVDGYCTDRILVERVPTQPPIKVAYFDSYSLRRLITLFVFAYPHPNNARRGGSPII